MKKVTVIIPAYKVEPYIKVCLKSVLTQTYGNLEIVVIDDASPDRSGLIAEEYAAKDKRIKVVHNTVNKGLSASRNVGIKYAKGDFIFFLDSDDQLRPEAISRLVEKAKDGILPVTGYDLELMPDCNIKKAEQAYGYYSSLRDWLNAFPKLFATKFNFAWGKLYHTNIIHSHKLFFDEGISLVEDLLFNLKYYEFCAGFYLDDYNGYIYRQTGSTSLSKKFDTKMIDWNIMSFTTLITFLNNHDMYNSINRAHLLANACNNFKYNFHLLAINNKYTASEKERIINDALSRSFVSEALCEGRTPLRYYQKILSYLIQNRHIRTYIRLENLRHRLK